jgi:hypothetical protein
MNSTLDRKQSGKVRRQFLKNPSLLLNPHHPNSTDIDVRAFASTEIQYMLWYENVRFGNICNICICIYMATLPCRIWGYLEELKKRRVGEASSFQPHQDANTSVSVT